MSEASTDGWSVATLQATFAATLVDEWARAGVTDAVVCPGSRSAPLALALAAHAAIRLHVRLDERGAGFFALGLARATGRPCVVCVTSGTAAAELHPAVLESHHGRVPLLVCTADRPPELHGIGAPQTVEQAHLYGGAVRWFAEPGVPVACARGAWRSIAARAAIEAAGGPLGPGPVHLNLAFRDPLVGEPAELPPGRPGGAAFHRLGYRQFLPYADDGSGLGPEEPWSASRGVIVAGEGCGPADAVIGLAEHLGWPLLADPRSGCRRHHPNVVAAADALCRLGEARLRPDVVVRLGDTWASKAMPAFLGGAYVIAVDPWWRWRDPDRDAGTVYRVDTGAWVAAARRTAPPAREAGWLEAWQEAERAAQGAIDVALGGSELTEPLVARRLLEVVPPTATVVVASSMPVRDLEWYAPALPSPPRVLANRGANGIDGACSTALGVAAAGDGGPTIALMGDLAFLHDASALAAAAGARAGGCVVVVLDNAGGGIFEFLPQATLVERGRFEQVFATPQASDVVRVAAGFGVETADVGTPAELEDALGAALHEDGVCVVRARVADRRANVDVHDRIHAAVAGAVARALGTPRP